MIGVLVNTVAVIVGSLIGMIFKKAIPKKITDGIMVAIGLCVIYVGVDGSLKGTNAVIAVVSMAIGGAIGTAIDIDKQLRRLGEWGERRFKKKKGEQSISEGFVSGSLVFCMGAMAIVGSLNSGLGVSGGLETIYTKSALDLISSTVLATGMGFGVMLSAIFVFVFQGGIVLLAGVIAPILTETMIAEITCVGSLIIIALGLNIIGVSKIKIANYTPALIIAPIATFIASLI